MDQLALTTLDGGEWFMSRPALAQWAAHLRGPAITPDDPGYDAARQVWNAMVDRRPGLIVRCAGVADVLQCVRLTRDRRLLTAVRGGGHNIAGLAMCDGGLVIDLADMKAVRVAPWEGLARVGPGATLGDFDREAQAFGLATPLGINSTTGVAGLTLGGGFGWLSRKFGLTVDNLVSADVVTADGDLVRASECDNPDLFWALQGGGGNFGVVTSFEYRMHRVGPEVVAGLIVHPLAAASEVVPKYRDVVAGASDELSCWLVLRKAPPLPFLPAEVHGQEVLIMALCHIGAAVAARSEIKDLMALGSPVGSHVDTMPFVAWQAAFDPLLGSGSRNYWKSHNLARLDDELIETVVAQVGRLPSPGCEVFIGHLGGATRRPAADATAYPHRDAEFVMNVHTRWEDPAQDDSCIRWARALYADTARFATGGVYVNFVSAGDELVAAAYGMNYQRLCAIKRRYDPQNLFRLNHNLRPQG